MPAADESLAFQALHIEVGRNATDDFNPFHDKNRWQNIAGNPFQGPITLGFQLECLLEEHLRQYREVHPEDLALIETEQLRYSNYEIKFLNAVRANESVTVEIKPSRFKQGENPTLSNRLSLKANGKLCLAGFKRESRLPLHLPEFDVDSLADLDSSADRQYIAGSNYFLKRKFLTTSNAKNFLTSSLVEQSGYIDEIADKVQFPEMFPCAWISSALLENAQKEGRNFEEEPLVYSTHNICVDRKVVPSLRSNDRLDILIRKTEDNGTTLVFECLGIVNAQILLFRSRVELAPPPSPES